MNNPFRRRPSLYRITPELQEIAKENRKRAKEKANMKKPAQFDELTRHTIEELQEACRNMKTKEYNSRMQLILTPTMRKNFEEVYGPITEIDVIDDSRAK